jgi:hypothetical protein
MGIRAGSSRNEVKPMQRSGIIPLPPLKENQKTSKPSKINGFTGFLIL